MSIEQVRPFGLGGFGVSSFSQFNLEQFREEFYLFFKKKKKTQLFHQFLSEHAFYELFIARCKVHFTSRGSDGSELKFLVHSLHSCTNNFYDHERSEWS